MDRNLRESTCVKIGGAAMFIFKRENALSSSSYCYREKGSLVGRVCSPEVVTLAWASTPKPGF